MSRAAGENSSYEGLQEGVRALDLLHLVRVHTSQASDLDLLVGAAVEDVSTLLQDALVDAYVGQLPVGALLDAVVRHHQEEAVALLKTYRFYFLSPLI